MSFANPYSYYLGLDLGQARDYSALAIIEEQLWIDLSWVREILCSKDCDRGLKAQYRNKLLPLSELDE